MKNMTKLLSIFLIIAMLFSLAACTVTPDDTVNGDVTENGNGENDGGENGGNENGGNGGGGNEALYAELADKFVTGALSQLEATKCIKFTVDLNVAESKDYTVDDYDTSYDESGYAEITVSEVNGKLAVQVYAVSKDESDGYIHDIATGNWVYNENVKLEYDVVEVIIKDGMSYERSYDYYDISTEAEIEAIKAATTWYAEADETGITAFSFTEAVAVIKEALDTDALSAIKEAVAEQLAANEITDGKIDFTYDFAPAVTEFLNYLKNVKSTDTIGKVINDLLANIDPELTVENIVAALLSYENKTINEVVAELEEYTVSEGMGTLQSIWDKIVASEELAMIAEMMGMPEESLSEMATFKISDILSVYGEYTVSDVLYTLIYAQSSEPEDEYEDDDYYTEYEYEEDFESDAEPTEPIMKAPEGFMMAMVQEYVAMLNTTFGDMDMDIYSFLYGMLGIEITPETAARKLSFTVSAEFDITTGAIKAFAFSYNIDLTIPTSTYGEYDETIEDFPRINGTATAKIDISFSVKELSGTAVNVEAPEDYEFTEEGDIAPEM